VSWYTLLEQGQDVHPSRQVLERLVQALRLTVSEGQHLFSLAGHDLPTRMLADEEAVIPALQRVVDALSPNPAYVIGQNWDIITWNRSADLLFHFQEPCPPHSRNGLWRFFQNEKVRQSDLDWEARARILVARFRAGYALDSCGESLQKVVEDLRRISPEFRVWWEEQDVEGSPDGARTINHPILGLLEFDHVTLQTAIAPDVRVKVYMASSKTTSKLVQVLSESV